MYLLGIDIGSSSVKASLLDAATGSLLSSSFSPATEMEIIAPRAGWAEQDPETWWQNVVNAVKGAVTKAAVRKEDIAAIGISYQMHGLVLTDNKGQVLRPSIIWCDSRAVETGNKILNALGADHVLPQLLNSPGNFTASKLAWVKENEPQLFSRIHKIMLPGDYIAMRLTGNAATTISGLSEGTFWNFCEADVAHFLFRHLQIDEAVLPQLVPSFAPSGELTSQAAETLGLKQGTKVCYRAGDQPNNAFSLNVNRPGEVAATAGTSGVIYGVTDQVKYDPLSRVNTFAHVNYSADHPMLGILLCINGTGILNSYMRNTLFANRYSYEEMNELAASTAPGAEGLRIFPYGNGAERSLCNITPGFSMHRLNFNVHTPSHLLRAAQEGIVFSLQYGFEIMKEAGATVQKVKAGKANMFLSPLFRQAFANVTQTEVELYNTDGARGAARGAGIGAGIYKDMNDAFRGLKIIDNIAPDKDASLYQEVYSDWKELLTNYISK